MKYHQTLRRGLGVLLSLVMCLSLLPATALAEGTSVAINEANFPDATFRTYISANFDKDSNGTLSAEEIAAVTAIKCNEKGIESLKGIEYFTALWELRCSYNKLTSLDVSRNTALTYLNCWHNQLTELKFGTALTDLDCSSNQLTELDVSGNQELTKLYCGYNQLTELDVSENSKLEYLSCTENQLNSLTISPALTKLYCGHNQLTELDVSSCTNLKELYCFDNQLRSLIVGDGDKEYLTELSCAQNQLTSLDLSGCPNLESLDAEDNVYEITLAKNRTFDLSTLPGGLDLSKASNWKGGTVSGNTLTADSGAVLVTYDYAYARGKTVTFNLLLNSGGTEIDIDAAHFPDEAFRAYLTGSEANIDRNRNGKLSDGEIALAKNIDVYGSDVRDLTGIAYFTALEDLDCGGNFLTELDVSKNTALTYLDCGGNDLTTLDVGKNTNLEELRCFGNDLTELDLSNNTALTYLDCSSNHLTALDVSMLTSLKTLDCSDNQLTSLNLINNTALTKLVCTDNQLTWLDLSSTKVTSLSANNNIYTIIVDKTRTFDLTKLPEGFHAENASNWSGGTVEGNTLKVDSNATQVTYSYNCGRNKTVTFTLEVVSYIITVSSSGGALSVAVTGLDAGEEAAIVAAQYSGARLVDVRLGSVTGTGSVVARDFVFTASRGDSYKVFLLSSAGAPLCAAKSTT